ncbi:hypothetical protein [Streptomyces noursei]|uniref:Uncharacterized protein n=1 Tax=Streptomyces noursei TaxID=1971 RepID=A0A2N8P7U9_STRNR|nr:hypothetical protein [Streptomyces noursei]PNE37093.1 hypothetical protein AOB60_22055 [Streptomyces noursei]
MGDGLLDLAIAEAGGHRLWNSLRGLKVDLSIGGPIWALKGWSPEQTFDQILSLDTAREHIVFSPFTRPDRRMVFDAATDSVAMETLDGEPVETLAPARAGFRGMLRNSPWDALHLGYFLGYACWNYFTTPFLFAYPGVRAHELEPWHEAGQTWRRLKVRFPPGIATHSPDQVFYFDAFGRQRRMDYVAEVNGSALVGHYTSRHRRFGGLLVATRRRVFRRNPDNTVNLNLPSITLDIHDVALIHADGDQTPARDQA